MELKLDSKFLKKSIKKFDKKIKIELEKEIFTKFQKKNLKLDLLSNLVK